VVFVLGGTTLGISFNGAGPAFNEAGATNVEDLYLIGDLVVGKKGGLTSQRLTLRGAQ